MSWGGWLLFLLVVFGVIGMILNAREKKNEGNTPMTTRTVLAALAAALLLALAGCGSAAHPRPVPTVTVTRTVTQTVKVKVRVPGPVRTVKVPEPGPTVTVNSGSAQLQADNTCIAALFDNIQSWKANGGMVPNGWWDSRCPVP